MPRVSEAHKEERRRDIIAAARRCFARSGFARATLQDVFAEAGLSAGAVYSYFQSKRDLVLAIAEERHVEERAALEAAATEDDPLEAIKAMMRAFFDAYLAKAVVEKRRLSLITWSEALLDEAVLASVQEGVREPRKALTALLKRGQKAGRLRKEFDAEPMAAAMVSMFQGLLLQKLWDPALDQHAVTNVCDALIEGIRA